MDFRPPGPLVVARHSPEAQRRAGDAVWAGTADEPDGSHAWHLFIIRLGLDRIGIDRAAVIEQLKALGIGTSVHFIPLHLHPYYRDRWGYQPADLPVAAREYERVISLPIWPGMTDADVDRVVAGLVSTLEPARR